MKAIMAHPTATAEVAWINSKFSPTNLAITGIFIIMGFHVIVNPLIPKTIKPIPKRIIWLSAIIRSIFCYSLNRSFNGQKDCNKNMNRFVLCFIIPWIICIIIPYLILLSVDTLVKDMTLFLDIMAFVTFPIMSAILWVVSKPKSVKQV